MPYHIENTQLRVVRKYSRQERNAKVLANTRILMIEHILPTTEEFINLLLSVDVEFFMVLAKPYSIDDTVYERLSKKVPLNIKSYNDLETTSYLTSLLEEAVLKSKEDKKNIVIVDVGGYFLKPLKELKDSQLAYITGLVEDTTFGHNRYLKDITGLKTVAFSVARSNLKRIEASFVGKDAVFAMDMILRKVGISIAGRNALLIGYGMIGKNVARALRNNDLNVYVYDKHDNNNLTAFIDGFHIHKKRELLKVADIIFLATGDPKGALTFDEIEECKDNVILVSVGSKDTEYDLKSINQQAVSCRKLNEHLTLYELSNSKSVISVKSGTAVNFVLPSIPVEVLDIVFSEILLCIIQLLKRRNDYAAGVLHKLPTTLINSIAKDWLRFVNS